MASAEDRNEQRRHRYRNDPEYRNKLKEQNRRAYWSRKDKVASRPRKLTGTKRRLRKQVTVLGGESYLTIKGMAIVLDRNENALRRWIGDGRFPAPDKDVRGVPLYTLQQAEGMLGVLREHFAEFSYYRRNHSQTMRRLREVFQASN